MHHAILRHGARVFFYGEGGDEVLAQATGTKVNRRTILYKPCVVTLGRLLVPACDEITRF